MSLGGLWIFAVVYFLAVATPGPGVASVVARSLARGTRGSMAFIAGFLVGDLVWFVLAAFGLSALAQAAYPVFVVLKYCGAAYLLYLAYRLWTSRETTHEASAVGRGERWQELFLASFTLTLANPKTMIFFLALLPTVVDLDRLTWTGIVELVVVISLVLPLVLGGYVLLASRARALFRSPHAQRSMRRGTSAAMAGAALWVAAR